MVVNKTSLPHWLERNRVDGGGGLFRTAATEPGGDTAII